MQTDHGSTHPLIGRSHELDRLLSVAGVGTAYPRPDSVLLAGDAGVGKTRLLAELGEQAGAQGWRVLTGHCLDLSDGALAYVAFSEVFGQLATADERLTAALAQEYPAVARLLPGRRMLSDHDQAGTADVERDELFEAVHAALSRVATQSPTLVIVEDAHWADQSTRELLSFCFARRFTHPVCVVVSYRSDDLHRRHPLRAAVAEWSRLPQVVRMQLAPLPDVDIRALVASMGATGLSAVGLNTVVARAEGNAFFTEELVSAAWLGGRDDGQSLPDDLADLLLLRLEQLDDVARSVVRAAAVAGRRVSHQSLSRVVDLEADRLELALRSVVEQHVMVTAEADTYAFRHALLAEAVYDDLLPGERARLHGAYAAALCQGEVAGTAADLARHARAANDPTTAAPASAEAGDDAMSVGGPDEAAHHYEIALELAANLRARPGDEPLPVDVVDVTRKAGEAITAAGSPHRAIAVVRDQLELLPATSSDEDRVRTLLALASAALVADTDVDTLDVSTEALGLLPVEEVTPLRARVLNVHARANAQRMRIDEATRVAEEAQRAGTSLGLPSVVADAALTLGRLRERSGDPEASRSVFEAVVDQARVDGDVTGEIRGLHHLGGLHFEAGAFDAALENYQAASRRATETGRPWGPYGIDARVLAALTAYTTGDWELAGRLTDIGGQAPPGLAEAGLAGVDMAVAAGRGDTAALDLLTRVRPWWRRDGMMAIIGGGAVIDLYGDAGDGDAAQAMYDEVTTTVDELWQWSAYPARIRLGAVALGQLNRAAAEPGRAERTRLASRAEALVAAAHAALDEIDRRGRRGPEALAWTARLEAEHARLRWQVDLDPPDQAELVGCWQRAVEAFESYGHVFETARSRARLASVLRAVGRREDTGAQAGKARAIAQRLGAHPLLAELGTTGMATSTPPAASGQAAQDLTPREHEILALVAQGRSNAEIGRRLYISAKTVSVHVSNVLAKLGADGRTEAAAVARRRGLLDD